MHEPPEIALWHPLVILTTSMSTSVGFTTVVVPVVKVVLVVVLSTWSAQRHALTGAHLTT